MAKRRKVQYPSSPNAFFDEMEREINNTKRKLCKKAEQLPPEKLFLQFDPSKKADDCNSKNVARSVLTNKTQWKPPIKAFSDHESFESSKIINTMNNDENKKNISSKCNENITLTQSVKTNNPEMICPNICLEENNHENRECATIDEDNSEVITINSSAESSRHNSPQPPLNDHNEKVCTQNEIPLEGTREMVILDNKIETAIQECIITDQQEGMIAENLSQKSAPQVDCKMESIKLSISNINQSICQDINDVMNVEESTDVRGVKTPNPSYENNFIQIDDVFEKENLSPKENDIPNLDPKIELPNCDNNIQPSKSIGNVNSCIAKAEPLETNCIADTESLDKPKGCINSYEALRERKLFTKDESIVEELVIYKNEKKIKPLTLCMEKEKCQSVEINSDCSFNGFVLKSDMADKTEKSGKSENVLEKTVKPDILCEPKILKHAELKPLETKFTATTENLDEPKIIDSNEALYGRELFPEDETVIEELEIKIGEKSKSSTRCKGEKCQNYDINLDYCLNCSVSTIDMADKTEKLGNSEMIIIETLVTNPEISCEPESLKNNIDKIQGLDEIDEENFDYLNPRRNQFTQNAEEAIELNDDLLSSCVSFKSPNPEKFSTLSKGIESSINAAEDLNIKSVFSSNSINDKNSEHENKNISIISNENEASYTIIVSGNETNAINEDELLNKDHSDHFSALKEQDCTQSKDMEEVNNETNHEFEQLLDEEKEVRKQNVDVDEEYSCFMISNSQLEEIEKNYYESSQHTTKNYTKASNANNCNQSIQLRPKANKIDLVCGTVEDKFDKVKHVNSPQVISTSLSPSKITVQKIQPKLPNVQWPKEMLEMHRKIRDLTGEVDRLNTLLMGFRRQIWPQKHGDNTST